MIGIVIVSHSAKLAEGVRELVDQMTKGRVPLAVSGGIEDPQHPIGTDAFDVQRAIESVYSDDGVIVLMDLGSALLSAETALEFLSEKQQGRIRLCEAPLVEGAVAAAVQAMVSNDIELVLAEARGALTAKTAQLKGAAPDMTVPAASTVATDAPKIRLTVCNRHGLHARPAARFVSTAGRFQARISIQNLSRYTETANAKSINQVATLGAREGHEIVITAEGADAPEALKALETLVTSGFGEAEAAIERDAGLQLPEASPADEGALTGIPASPGIAIGPIALYRLAPIAVPERPIENPMNEWQRLQQAIEAAQKELHALRALATAQVGDYQAAIFDAHLLYLEDPALLDAAHRRIFDRKMNVEAAWQSAVEKMVAAYRDLEDPYQQARAADVIDMGQRVLKLLMGVVPASVVLARPSIVVAADLTPSDTAQLDPDKVLGICTEFGSATSHAAILARGMGIPAVMGVGMGISRLAEETTLALDGAHGRVWVEPNSDLLAELKSQRESWAAEQQAVCNAGRQPALTRDGRRIKILANIGGAVHVKGALEQGAEGVGLLRTEFLFLARVTPPSEDEQTAAYHRIADTLGPHPLIIRTLDVGGDKPLPYLDLEVEANPFLGLRGIRLCLDRPEILKTQLRAILRASPGHRIKVMFPMVSTLTEIRAAKKILATTRDELSRAGVPFEKNMEVGMMVEVPAAVALADQMAAEVDFFSIGTNDLSQYIMAADRTNPRVQALSDAFQPAVLRTIQYIIERAHAAGIWVGLCGELAGDPLAVTVLLGLGLDEFSMNPPAIPAVKRVLSKLTMVEAEAIATAALKLETAEAVRELVKSSGNPISRKPA
ncbi:MAG: phosphoenolpyruvate--protein phosphotransferase [Desulfosarcina sp.]|nr:phosphoenolpyruvate--protein phosphotransferase [Desulfosarcina sp.]